MHTVTNNPSLVAEPGAADTTCFWLGLTLLSRTVPAVTQEGQAICCGFPTAPRPGGLCVATGPVVASLITSNMCWVCCLTCLFISVVRETGGGGGKASRRQVVFYWYHPWLLLKNTKALLCSVGCKHGAHMWPPADQLWSVHLIRREFCFAWCACTDNAVEMIEMKRLQPNVDMCNLFNALFIYLFI